MAGRRESSGEEFSEDEDMFTIDLSSDEEGEADGSRYCVRSACTVAVSITKCYHVMLTRPCRRPLCLNSVLENSCLMCESACARASVCAPPFENQLHLLDALQGFVLFPQKALPV